MNQEEMKTVDLEEMNQVEPEKVEGFAKQRKKSIRNSIISIIAFALVTVALFSAQTYAYFTADVESNQNRIASGKLDIELIELKNTAQGETVYVNPVEFMPATEVSKIVKVKNTGDLPVYIRVKIEKSINKDVNAIPVDWENLITCDFALDDPDTAEMEALWTYHDGYYYYNMPLDAGSATVPLFEHVYFSAAMGNEFANSKIGFTVKCEATQANGNGTTAWEAVGWPVNQVEN